MCHVIFPRIEKLVANAVPYKYGIVKYKGENMFLGCKRMFYGLGSGVFGSIYLMSNLNEDYEYKYNIEDEVIVIRDNEVEQKISFHLPVLLPDLEQIVLFNYIKAGMHISPLLKYEDNSYKLLLEKTECEDEYMISTLIVAFREQDIIFFDGEDVSVRKFMIFKPDIVVEFIDEIIKSNQNVNIEFNDSLLDDYRLIYDDVMKIF